MPSTRTDTAGLAWQQGLVVVAALAVTLLFLAGLAERDVAFDLVDVYIPAAERVLDGETPYHEPDDPVWIGHQAYVYPPLTALIAAPLTVVPSPWVAYAGAIGALAILLVAVWIAGLRDARCYAAFALWPSTMTAWQNANVTVLLVLAVALLWRFRDSVARAGAALGLAVALKLLLWPLGVWLLATRRVAAAATATVVAVLTLVASWAVIGFAGLTSYPDVVRKITEIEGENSDSVSIYSGVLAFGLPESLAYAASFAVAAVLLAASFLLARRGDDIGSFTLALVGAMALTPLVWMHYLCFLAVPLVVYRPRFSPLWVVPWLMWATQLPGWPFEPRRPLALIVVAVLVWALVVRTHRPPASSQTAPSTVPATDTR